MAIGDPPQTVVFHEKITAGTAYEGFLIGAITIEWNMTNPSWCKVFHNYGDLMLTWLEELCWRAGSSTRDQMVLLESNDGAQFRCHQWVLARWSPFFEALFSRAFAEHRHARAKLENVDGEALESILNYFLHGR